MPLLIGLFKEIARASSPQARLRSLANLLMWFAAGAYVTSTVTGLAPFGPDGLVTDVVGGLLATAVGVSAKAF